jgi:hypothetical protein
MNYEGEPNSFRIVATGEHLTHRYSICNHNSLFRIHHSFLSHAYCIISGKLEFVLTLQTTTAGNPR